MTLNVDPYHPAEEGDVDQCAAVTRARVRTRVERNPDRSVDVYTYYTLHRGCGGGAEVTYERPVFRLFEGQTRSFPPFRLDDPTYAWRFAEFSAISYSNGVAEITPGR